MSGMFRCGIPFYTRVCDKLACSSAVSCAPDCCDFVCLANSCLYPYGDYLDPHGALRKQHSLYSCKESKHLSHKFITKYLENNKYLDIQFLYLHTIYQKAKVLLQLQQKINILHDAYHIPTDMTSTAGKYNAGPAQI